MTLDLPAYVAQCRKYKLTFVPDDFENQIERLTLSREEYDKHLTKDKRNRMFRLRALYAMRQGYMKRCMDDELERLEEEEAAAAANGIWN